MEQEKKSDFLFRQAEIADLERIWEIILQAKAQMKRLGSTQWDESYPTTDIIREDIETGEGYVLCKDGQVIAYGVASFNGEPVYLQIEELWEDNGTYLIVHRLAVADEAKHQGVAKQFMLAAEAMSRERGIFHARIDTKYDNNYMLRLIDSLHYKYIGEVYYRGINARKAFEKTL